MQSIIEKWEKHYKINLKSWTSSVIQLEIIHRKTKKEWTIEVENVELFGKIDLIIDNSISEIHKEIRDNLISNLI